MDTRLDLGMTQRELAAEERRMLIEFGRFAEWRQG
jgi:hypothetical protein